MSTKILPLAHPTEATMRDYEQAKMRLELILLRDFWMARWSMLRGVHPLNMVKK
jgi:hypothetical protein